MGDSLATIDMGRKLGGCAVSKTIIIVYYATKAANAHTQLHVQKHNKTVAWAEAYQSTKLHLDPSNRLATRHQHHRQTGQTDRTDNGQRSDSIGRTVLQTVAQKSISIWKSCRHGACSQLLSTASGEHVCRSQQTLNTIHSMVIVTSRTANECKFRVN